MQPVVLSYRVRAPEICNAFQMSDSCCKYQSRLGRHSSLFRKHQYFCPKTSQDCRRIEKEELTPVHSTLHFHCTVITLNRTSQYSLAGQILCGFLEATYTLQNPPATLRADQTGNTALSTVGDQHAFMKANKVRNVRHYAPF